jgi:hypothetical protein
LRCAVNPGIGRPDECWPIGGVALPGVGNRTWRSQGYEMAISCVVNEDLRADWEPRPESGSSRAGSNPDPLVRGAIEQDSRSAGPALPVVSVATRKGGQEMSTT